MVDSNQSFWSRLMERGSANAGETAKHICPYDRKSCGKTHDGMKNSATKSSGRDCHSGCPEPKKPLRPEEFCPELGRPKPPPSSPCCFIQMQDPCAPCCCPPPAKCEEECHPGRKRQPICGCDLCRKKQCLDDKCCSPSEPSCRKGVRTPTHLEKA